MASTGQIASRESQPLPSSAGLRRALVALGVAIAVWCLPYLVPGLERFRPWTREDPTPFAGLLGSDRAAPVIAEASGGLEFDGVITEREQELLAAAGPGGQAVAGTGSKPTTCADGRAASGEGDDYRDVTVPIEDPRGNLSAFYQALARTACREDKAVTRIAHWGDSAIVRDGLTAVAREHLQKQFGDAGHGFILVAPPSRWYVHRGVRLSSTSWTPLRITHGEASDGCYGYGATAALGSTESGSTASFATIEAGPLGRRVDRFRISFRRGPGQGALLLRVDGGPTRTVSAAATAWEDAVHTVSVSDGAHRLGLKIQGSVRVYGVSLERSGPGVIYDSLGVLGCFDERLLALPGDHWREQLKQQKPDLLVLMFGGNALGLPSFPAASYGKSFEAMLKLFRAARPQASCLVMSPVDHGERHGSGIRTKPAVKQMIAIQRAAALRNRCAYYSIFDAMGGEGTVARWSRSKPRLVSADLSHASHLGNRILGTLLHRALMAGFRKHQASSSRPEQELRSSR